MLESLSLFTGESDLGTLNSYFKSKKFISGLFDAYCAKQGWVIKAINCNDQTYSDKESLCLLHVRLLFSVV
jgi:hypothetical protein